MGRGFTRFTATSLTLGFAFLYLPIVLLVIYSFNASKLVTVWGGFSLQWYAAMLQNQALLEFGLGHPAGRRPLLHPGPGAGHHGRRGPDPHRPLPRPHPVLRHDLGPSGHARGDPRPVPAAFVRQHEHRPRLLDHRHRAHHLRHVLRHRGRPVAPGHLRPQPRGGGDGPGRHAAQDLLRHHPADHRPGPDRRLAAGLHPLARRSGHRQLHHRPGCDHPADADLQLGPAGRDARDQRHLHGADRHRHRRRDHRRDRAETRPGQAKPRPASS